MKPALEVDQSASLLLVPVHERDELTVQLDGLG